MSEMLINGLPSKQGLYDPRFEHDACGIGFIANINGDKSNDIIRQALTALVNLDHRGGQGAEQNTGDGAGILMQIPHAFMAQECSAMNIALPAEGHYGVGMLFLPRDRERRLACERVLERIVAEEGLSLLGWRTVPTDNTLLGNGAKAVEPFIRQVFIEADELTKTKLAEGDDKAVERKLYVIRKRAENAIRHSGMPGVDSFYFSSLSSRTIVYKGMLTPFQVDKYFLELKDPVMETALALVHSRYSTNTFPSWERAHPNRYMIHNGEINTVRGNVNWMFARQAMCETELFGEDLAKVMPVVDMNGTDSAMFDNCLEFLTLTGRSMPHAMMMMVPEPWEKNEAMSPEKKAFYQYHSFMMEPWDGPAAIVFSDGRYIGASLDRNGLRPARYYVTKDGLIVMSSEVGVIELATEDIILKDRIRPGRMLLVDTQEGKIISDEDLKTEMAAQFPYQEWLKTHMMQLEDLEDAAEVPGTNFETLLQRQHAFGYTYEELMKTIEPLAKAADDPVSSMGYDAPLAVLSDQPQLLYNYFKQLFAQVTNPPIDSIREELVTAISTTIGPEKNLLKPTPDSCRQIKVAMPVITNAELAKLRHIRRDGFKSVTLPIVFGINEGSLGLKLALDGLCVAADRAIATGANVLILSDREVSKSKAPIPALLAVSCLHHHLIKSGTRLKSTLLLESAEPREVHHFAALLGYGVSAVNPYFVYETLEDMLQEGLLEGITHGEAVNNFNKGITKGVVKILSKMGISTIQGYRGAQIFECVGINQEVVDRYFTGTPSRIGGIGLEEIAKEVEMRHWRAFNDQPGRDLTLDSGSVSQWRSGGEEHLYNPQSITTLQSACRLGDYRMFQQFTKATDDQTQKLKTIRGLLKFKAAAPIPLEEVESVESILKRFKTGAMSFGSISQEAHETLAIAMNRIGGKSNTGEGGEDPARFVKEANGDLKRSATKQVASGRFGVNSHYLVNADELQIKMAQGAKPGEGGQLPGGKVFPWIAKARRTTAGVGLISPPPHHDIYSIEDLAELIHDLKNANPKARINVKLVSEVGVGTIAAGVAKGHADVVVISGYDGGTGASPKTSIRHAGLPWELGVAEAHQTLLLNRLRDRIVVETDGKLLTGRDVVIAALLGAEEYTFATGPLVVVGCVMMRVCNLDTCPTGVATQNPELRKKFSGKPEYVVNFMRFIAQEMREYMAELGFKTINEMVGRTDLLEVNEAVKHWKSKQIDLQPLLYKPDVPDSVDRYCTRKQDHGLEKSLDARELIPMSRRALERGESVEAKLKVKNTDRVVGTMLGSEVTRRYGEGGLKEDTIVLKFEGSAGQSFGAFVPKGMTLMLEGDANDYFGKGLSGGKLIVYPPSKSVFEAEKNIITGNVNLYGGTAGEAYISGIAGERFCVRNSGVKAVVEGVGDHGCEYMTGGRVVVLGKTGRNFAAGMSGGIAYVWDRDGAFISCVNQDMVLLERLESEEEIRDVRNMIEKHVAYTGSRVGQRAIRDWADTLGQIIKVIPVDYKRMQEAIKNAVDDGHTGEEAIMAAFEQNRDSHATNGKH